MLSSAKIGTSSWRYYTDSVACRPTEYYPGVGEAPGRWHGRGLEQLGLAPGAVVSEQQLEALFGRALDPATGASGGDGRAPGHARSAVEAGHGRDRADQHRRPGRRVVRPPNQPVRGPAAAHPRLGGEQGPVPR